jgi:hypothetical protein
MAQASAINIFTGGMNMDINPSFMKDGDYTYAENVRIGFSESDNMGAVENVKSTLPILNTYLDNVTGRYKTICAAPYESKSILYYFVKDTQGTNDAIYEFNLKTSAIVQVLSGVVLGFGDDIKSANYFSDMLTWTDGVGEVRQIFVSLAKQGVYQSFMGEYTTLIKPQPDTTIIATLMEDATVSSSSFEDKNYQFIYRYVFFGNQKSAWSMPSRMVAYGYDTNLKKMRLSMNPSEVRQAPYFQKLIAYIEIGMRDEDSQPWKLIKRLTFPTVQSNDFYYDFYNDSIYPVISTLETNRFYDDVPRTSQAMALVNSRLMLGNNKTGFNNVPLIQALDFTPSLITDPLIDNGCYFKSGGTYGVGVELYDRYQRRTFTYPLGGFTAIERNGSFKATQVGFKLVGGSTEGLPEWCEYWAIAMTKCNNKGSFQQVHVTIDGSSTNHKIIFSSTFATPTKPQIAWVYSTGDKCSIRTVDAAGNPSGAGFFNIPLQLDSTSGNFYIEWDGTTVLPTCTTGAIFELFAPIKSTETQFYYEVGELNPITLDVNGKRRFGTDFSQVGKTITITGGDTQYRVSDNCEAMASSEKFFETWSHNIGRPNTIDTETEGENLGISELAYSNAYSQGTKLNGLNTFEFLSKETYPMELGAITKLTVARDFEVNGSVLLVTTEYNNYSVYIGKTQIKNPDGSTQLVTNNAILGTYNLLAGGFGSINPESVHAFGTTVRGFDLLKGVLWRYSTDGLTAISQQYGTNSYVSHKASEIYATTQKNVAAYDPYFDEYVICIKGVNEQNPKCLAFNEDANKFSTFYDMNPDWMATLNRYLISWKNGVLYVHRKGSDYNTLQDKKVKSKISYVAKSSPFLTVNSISERVYSQDEWKLKVEGCKKSTKPRQVSETLKADYGEESYLYPIKVDTNTRNDMKSRHFVISLELGNNVDYLSVLYGTETILSGSNPSPAK